MHCAPLLRITLRHPGRIINDNRGRYCSIGKLNWRKKVSDAMKEKWSVCGSESRPSPLSERGIWSRYWSFHERLRKNEHVDPLFYFIYFKKIWFPVIYPNLSKISLLNFEILSTESINYTLFLSVSGHSCRWSNCLLCHGDPLFLFY